ncbi:MAG: hypothetical protein QOJ07_2475 [Thermoleophilaceae bacterium]|nr:hypothetical protein [Thermoleophilaceae bacterium]
MTAFDQLAPEGRAVLELVLKRGRSYAKVADMLDMRAADVAELAHEALEDLTPVSSRGVDGEWRGAVGNFVLGQTTRGEEAEARDWLRRSEAARTWALSLVDVLTGVAKDGVLPEITDIKPERTRPARKAVPVDRRLTAGLGALAAALAIALIVSLASGGGDDKKSGGSSAAAAAAAPTGAAAASGAPGATGAQGAQATPKAESQGTLKPEPGETATGPAGIYAQGTRKILVVQAKLQPVNVKTEAYEVWLWNSNADVQPIGVQGTDSKGVMQGAAELPKNYAHFKNVVVSREKTGTSPKAPTHLVARAALAPVKG